MLIGLIIWVLLGFAGGLVCLSIEHWKNDHWLDETNILFAILACIVMGPILLGMMIFLKWYGNKYSLSNTFRKG